MSVAMMCWSLLPFHEVVHHQSMMDLEEKYDPLLQGL